MERNSDFGQSIMTTVGGVKFYGLKLIFERFSILVKLNHI